MGVDSLRRELDVAVRLAQRAGDRIMGYYQTGLAVDHKARREPVTAADRVADEIIAAGLRDAFPADGLLTEESDDDLARLKKERVWIVDPLDGTVEFIAGTGEFAVQIALAVGGYPVLGVVYQPARGQLFYAVQGQGAWQVCQGRTTPLRVSTVAEPARMCLVISRSHDSDLIEAARQALGIGSVKRVGSVGLKVGLVARGACDLYLALYDECEPRLRGEIDSGQRRSPEAERAWLAYVASTPERVTLEQGCMDMTAMIRDRCR